MTQGTDYSFNDRSILVTGGTGSFGRRFIETLFKRYSPRRVVVYSRDELKQFEMREENKYAKTRSGVFEGRVINKSGIKRISKKRPQCRGQCYIA